MDFNIELAIKRGQWGLVAKYASQLGRHKGRPVRQVEIELKAYVKSLKRFREDPEAIIQNVLGWIMG